MIPFPRLIAFSMLAAGAAVAEEADHRAAVEELNRVYMEAIEARDYEAAAQIYAEDALYLPAPGGVLEGREQIRSFYEQAQLRSVDVGVTRVDPLGDSLISSTGIARVTLGEAAGGAEVESEYFLIGEVTDDGRVVVRRLVSFLPRGQMDAPAGQ